MTSDFRSGLIGRFFTIGIRMGFRSGVEKKMKKRTYLRYRPKDVIVNFSNIYFIKGLGSVLIRGTIGLLLVILRFYRANE